MYSPYILNKASKYFSLGILSKETQEKGDNTSYRYTPKWRSVEKKPNKENLSEKHTCEFFFPIFYAV
jgi:hypothetical protein